MTGWSVLGLRHLANSTRSNSNPRHFIQYSTGALGANQTSNLPQQPDLTIPIFALLIVISIITAAGNALIIFALVRTPALKTPSNLFIGSLAVADLLIGVFVMPVASYYYVLNNNTWDLGLPVCQLWLCLDYFASCSSILNLVAMSLDRYFSIAHALKYRQYKSVRVFLAIIAGIWLVSSVYTIPILFWHLMFNGGVRQTPPGECRVEFEREIAFKVISLVFSFFIPFIIMYLVYIRIFVFIHRRTKQSLQRSQKGSLPATPQPPPTPTPDTPNIPSIRNCKPPMRRAKTVVENGGAKADHENEVTPLADGGTSGSGGDRPALLRTFTENNGLVKSTPVARIGRKMSLNLAAIRRKRSTEQQREIRAAKQLAIIMLTFTVCWLPYMTIYLAIATEHQLFKTNFATTFFTLSAWLGYINSSLNPFLYPLCIDSFKKAFREMLGCGDKRPPGATRTAFPLRRTGPAGAPTRLGVATIAGAPAAPAAAPTPPI